VPSALPQPQSYTIDAMHVAMSSLVKGALSGKTIGRTLFNATLAHRARALHGRVLDIAGGASSSYLPLLPKGIELVRTDFAASPGVIAVDMNKPLPFEDGSFDAVLLFNALYAAEEPLALAREIHRVLKEGGTWYLASPFIANEMPEPHDYLRFTGEGLERLCSRAGFTAVSIERLGDRASAAVQLMHPFYLFNAVRALVYPLAIFFDGLIPRRARRAHPAPLSYFVCAQK